MTDSWKPKQLNPVEELAYVGNRAEVTFDLTHPLLALTDLPGTVPATDAEREQWQAALQAARHRIADAHQEMTGAEATFEAALATYRATVEAALANYKPVSSEIANRAARVRDQP
ncbi:hypothetical protein [Kitasatospora viridis]|uniref:Uncharacterized protein n=1 Tax=Kitasatospora viridis TaxID=281105 RepID=A0A561SA43_9ACTN|nr:hypothetical protein [Kitasatospora viridis]TWF71740.1 hypothetical protein FHX73_18111 [Kitasatospora viridis]